MIGAGGGLSLAALEEELDGILSRLRRLEREAAVLVRGDGSDHDGGVQRLTSRLESIRRACADVRRAVTRSAVTRSSRSVETREADGRGGGADSGMSGQEERVARFGLRARSGLGARTRPKNPARAEARAHLQGALDSIAKTKREGADARLSWALDVLGGTPESSPEELRQCYRDMLRKTHPDVSLQKSGAPSAVEVPTFADVQKAWDVLREQGLAH